MISWIRIDRAISDDPKVSRLARELSVRAPEAVGLLVGVWSGMAIHAPSGNLADVDDTLLAKWAGWHGKPARFAAALRALFLDAAGTWPAWDKHNGSTIRKAQRDAERLRVERERRATGGEDVARASRDGRAAVAGTNVTNVTNELPPQDQLPVGAVAPGGKKPRAKRPKSEPKYPHFPQAHRTAALERWSKRIGAVNPATLFGCLGPLFAQPERAAALSPFELAEVVSTYAHGRERAFQSPADFAAKFEHWWADYRRSRREDGQTLEVTA